MHLITLSLILPCADTQYSHNHLSDIAFRKTSVYNLFRDRYGEPIDLSTTCFIKARAKVRMNFCNWRGVQCAHGAIRSLIVERELLGRTNTMDTRWLPQTLEYLWVRNVPVLGDLNETSFPRDLVFACLTEMCTGLGARTLSRLPLKIEELLISSAQMRGPVILTKLPQSLRFLFLCPLAQTGPIFYDSTALPKGIVNIHILFTKATSHEYEVDTLGEQLDKRVTFGWDRPDLDKVSRHYAKMKRKAEQIYVPMERLAAAGVLDRM